MTFDSFEPHGKVLATRDSPGDAREYALHASRAFAQGHRTAGWSSWAAPAAARPTWPLLLLTSDLLKAATSSSPSYPELLDHLRYTYSPDSRVPYDELFDRIKEVPLLVLDDLGAESPTPWANEKLYQIIVHRHNGRLPTIVTMPIPEENPEGSRSLYSMIKSRLLDHRIVTEVDISAPDYRDANSGTTPKEFRKYRDP